MRAHVARLALLAPILIAAGCGGSGSSSSNTNASVPVFRTDYKATVAQFKNTSHAIGLAVQHASGETDSQIGTEFTALASQWQTDLDHLNSLTPPPSVSGPFTTLKVGATSTENDLRAIVAAAHSHDGSAARQAGEHLVRDILKAKAASEVISHKLGIS
jgi:hypothetical protein